KSLEVLLRLGIQNQWQGFFLDLFLL
ncbi:MAG: hypothetical protein RL677_794, partial [Actinomycetota bacterium]